MSFGNYRKFGLLVLLLLASMSVHTAFAASPCQVAPVCQVNVPSDIATAVSQVNTSGSGYTQIEIMTMLTCSGQGACAMDINGVTGTAATPIQIFGAPGVQAGFQRIDSYGYNLLSITNSSYVTVSNLVFREMQANVVEADHSNGLCSPTTTEVCASPIVINHSSAISLTGIIVNMGKVHDIEVSNVTGLSVTNSVIKNAFEFGIWFDNNAPTHNNMPIDNIDINIQNNNFVSNRSNAILYTGTASNPAQPSVISNNTFNHNHHNAAFYVCGSSQNQACSGGQLDFQQGTSHLVVSGNTFENGYMDTDPSIDGYAQGNPQNVVGIELGGLVTDVTIERNTIDNDSAQAIATDADEVSGNYIASGVFIYQNEIFGNQDSNGHVLTGDNQIDAPYSSQFENCWTQGCLASVNNTTPQIDIAGLGCSGNQCMWIEATNAGVNCAVGIYTSNWSSQLATITPPVASCTSQGVAFIIPGWIRSEYGSVIVNYQNTSARTWSQGYLMSLAGTLVPKITGLGLGCSGGQCIWITATDTSANCAVGVYSPSFALLATITPPTAYCTNSGVTFVIPASILANYSSVYVNYQNVDDGSWSALKQISIP